MTTASAHDVRSYITVGQENSTPIDLYYEDHGAGRPVVLIHGFPLNGASWEKQARALLAAGHRVITYDHRGFGKSSQPATGYHYDTFAEDLHKLLTELDLRDVALVGFSMGGGEVARYLGSYGSERVRKAVFISPIVPLVLKTPDNPAGVEPKVFDGIAADIRADRPAFLTAFLREFYNLDLLGGTLISDQAVQLSWTVAVGASATATHDCVATWMTDFRKDVARIDVPTLVIQGDADRILPIAATGLALSKAVKGARLVTIEGGPHGILWTHGKRVSAELVKFLE
jgi:non-heme chloroperoxidase